MGKGPVGLFNKLRYGNMIRKEFGLAMKTTVLRLALSWHPPHLDNRCSLAPRWSAPAQSAVWAALLLLAAGPLRAADRQVVPGQVPAAVARLQATERLPATQHLNLAIGLPLRNQSDLTSQLQHLYDPASPSYHQWLTPEQFTERFGPTEADYQAVVGWARAHRLNVTVTHPNRVILDVEGAVADIEAALQVALKVYQHPSEARTFYAPDAEPSLDLAVPILHISGLENFFLPRPHFQAQSLDQWPEPAPSSGSGPNGTYMGKDFRAAYTPDTTLTGSGQTVGLLQFNGYTASDITYYESKAGLPNVTLTNVLLDGYNGVPVLNGGEVEVSLDIEMSISMAPGLSKIMVYEAGPSGIWHDILNRMATDNLAKQLSCSWYIPNGVADPVADQIFQQMAAQGQSFFAASGDRDAYVGLIPFPGDTPYITEVGGTTLTTSGPGGSWQSEKAWNWGNGTGSGGGISTQYPIPSWQTNINMTSNQGSTTERNTPDVALTADNVYVRADGGDQNVGGTSCAAPLWAGFTALLNQQGAFGGRPAIGFINPAVYALGAATNYASAFHDITAGNNTNSSSPTRFYAVPGYDLCTGWGTPAGQNLITALEPLVKVTLPASATEGDGLLAGAGGVQLVSAPATNLTVGLTSSDPIRVLVSSSVIVPAGQSNAAFDLTIVDDGLLEGTQVASITASVPGQGTGSASMSIFDKEAAVLQVALPPSATEGQTALPGTVQISGVPAADIAVSLSSSDTTEIQVPAVVVVPAGQTSTVFTAAAVINNKLESPQSVTVTAHVQNWTDGTASITVFNTNSWTLTLTLPPSVMENAGVLTNAGIVALSGILATDLAVSLTSSNAAKLIVPATVTIPAGQLSNAFNLTLVESPVPDGHQTVSVTASAPNFTNGMASIFIIDDKSPFPPSNPRPGDMATNVSANTNLMWNNGTSSELVVNGGFESGTLSNWVQVPSLYGRFVINNGTYKPFSPDPPLPPFAGNFSALGDENGPGIFYMYQDVSIPSGVSAATLSWAHRVRNFYSSFSSLQQFQVRLCNTNNVVLATPFTTSLGDPLLGDWVQKSYDVTGYAGQKVRVMFWVNPGGYYLDVHLDNVSVQINTNNAVTTNDVYFGTNPTPGLAEFQGGTTNSAWALPLLAPLTTYYWQIVAHRGGTGAGPVWRFTTQGVDHYVWGPIYSPQTLNQPFNAAITAKDAFSTTVTNFTGTVSLAGVAGGGQATNHILGNVTPTTSSSGNWTLGYAFTPTNNLVVTHVRHYFGSKISIWTDSGTLVATQSFVSTPGSWVETPLAVPVLLQAGTRYRVAGYTGNAIYYWRTNPPGVFPDGAINQALYSSGDAFPTLTISNFWVLVDLRYTVGSATSIAISPTNSGSFVNGAWTGGITVLQPATNVVLSASDSGGHTGSSSPFAVNVANDISITAVDTPHPVSAGANLTYTLTIANTGPSDATGVMVTNLLPASATFLSATTSQGTWAQNGGMVTGSLGVVPGGTNATMTIVVIPSLAGTILTNVAMVSRAEPDGYLGNNTATVTTPVTTPAISIADSSVVEGTIGATNMLFPLTLAVPSAQAIRVNYATANGTASAGKDYIGTNGVASFPAGVTNQSIAIAVIGSTVVGSNKTFFVNLSNPINGTLGRAQAVGTIINSNGLPGQMDHFAWGAIASPQYAAQPFNATITALDFFNNPVIGFSGTANLTGLAGLAPGTLFSDDFESGNFLSWTIGSTPATRAVTNDTAASGIYSFTMIGGNGTHYQGIWHSLSNVTPAQISFYVRASATTFYGGYFVVANATSGAATSTTNTAAFFYMTGAGTMGLYEDAGGAHLVPYVANQWYKISLLLNWTNKTMDYLVDGTLAFAAVPFRAPSVNSLAIVHLYNFDSTRAWWDDIQFVGGNFPVPIIISPTNSGAFVSGAWTGSVMVAQPATNASLVADDGVGHNGQSNPFNVIYRPPLAVPDALTTPVNTPASFPAAKLTLNDVDFYNSPLTVMAVSAVSAQGGGVALASGLVTYTPAANFSGNDSFTYTISDGYGATAVGTVTATVGNGGAVSLNIVFGPTIEGGNFVVGFAGVPGLTYTIESAPDLASPWTKVANVVAPTTDQGFGIGVFEYTEPVNGSSTRLFRTVYPAY